MRKILILFLIFSGCLTSSKEPLNVVLSVDYEDLSRPSGGENLPALLDLLDRRNISSTFFILGATAERYPGNVRAINDRGHTLGLHTYYHNFPLFSEEGVAIISGIYNVSTEVGWSRSFKTPEAFKVDLEANKKAINRALGREAQVEMFRAPSMVVNWVNSDAYYEALREMGIKLDSSTYQDFENPRAYYVEKGVLVVPIVTFDARLGNQGKALELAEKSSRTGVPFHLVAHPQNLEAAKLMELDEFLRALEARYEVRYLRVEEVPGRYLAK